MLWSQRIHGRQVLSQVRSLPVLVVICISCLVIAFSVGAQETVALPGELDDETRVLLEQAQGLIRAGESEQAYEMLAPRELELAGHGFFDYLLGVSALDSGRFSEAIFSLRRSLVMAPEFSGARMELARAYYALGNVSLSQPIFEELLTENPPPAVRAVITQYLDTMALRPLSAQSSFSPYVEARLGIDSNANGSTRAQQFLGFVLSDRNVEADSSFAEMAAGFDWLQLRDQSFGWMARVRGSHRSNPDVSFMDSTVLSGLGGAVWQRDRLYGNATLDSYWSARDGDSNETYAGFGAMLGWNFKDGWDFVTDLRWGGLRFDERIDVMDVDRVLLGLAVVRRLASGGSFQLQAIGGSDSERETFSPYGNSKAGARLAADIPMGGRARLTASLGNLETDYDGAFFGVARTDTQRTALVEVVWRDVIISGLSLSPRLLWIDNESSVALYTYDRTEVGLNVRYTPR